MNQSSTDPTRRTNGWIVRAGEERIEIEGLDALRALAAAGRIERDHYIYDPGKERWFHAREVSELSDVLAPAATVSSGEWIVQADGQTHRFADLESLQQAVRSGSVTSSSLLRHPLLERWMRAGEVAELGIAFVDAPPPVKRAAAVSRANAAIAILVVAIVGASAYMIWRGSAVDRHHSTTDALPAVADGVEENEVQAPEPRVTTWVFNDDGELEQQAGEGDVEGLPAEEPVAAAPPVVPRAAMAPSPTSDRAEPAAAERPRQTRPPIDDAEADYLDEDRDIVFRPTAAVRGQVAGDTPVLIDRSGSNRHFHLAGCRAVTASMTTVSLDLARQSYSACPICRPPH
jgi:hypothetical protein